MIVHGLAEGGPAQRAGVQLGDRVIAVDGEPVGDLRDLWAGIWAAGDAGATVRLQVGRGTNTLDLVVTSADRANFLRRPPLQ